MLRLIRSCLAIPNVSHPSRHAFERVRSTANLLNTLPRPSPLPLSAPPLSSRSLTTTRTSQNPTQSAPRKLDIFLPRETAAIKHADHIIPSQTQEDSNSPLPCPPTPSPTSTTTTSPPPPPPPPQHTPLITPITTHHDLASYTASHTHRLACAPSALARTRLSTSSVHLGTRYEYLIQAHLQARLRFSLTRVGGRGDGGVDLLGTWTPSSSVLRLHGQTQGEVEAEAEAEAPTFRVLLQAKRLAAHRKPTPAPMRELDGTVHNAASSRWIAAAFAVHAASSPPLRVRNDDDDVVGGAPGIADLPALGVLVTTRPLTAGVEKVMGASRRPLMYVCLEEVVPPTAAAAAAAAGQGGDANAEQLSPVNPSTRIRQMVWNAAASRAGLEGYNVVTKYTESVDGGIPDSEAVLVYQGQPLT